MEKQDLFLIPVDGKLFTSDTIKECAHVSFPGTDLSPVLVASKAELIIEDIIDFVKSNGLTSENYRITCFTKKIN